jgi:DNA-binding response OmpR family regulator
VAHQASHPLELRTSQERAVYDILFEHAGRVVSRSEIARCAGIADLNPRRCDALMVAVRRAVGPDAIVTVRRRGWMLVAT